MEIAYIFLDALLIGLLITGIVYAVRLNKQLAELRSSRVAMERFVSEFSVTVSRAEAGIKGLKQAARSCGDDLEQLIDKSQQIRDELHFLTESADQMATRLSQTAAATAKVFSGGGDEGKNEKAEKQKPADNSVSTASATVTPIKSANTAAEKELLKALEKMG